MTERRPEAVALSVVMVAGDRRERCQRSLDALSAQEVAGRLEIRVVDTAPLDVAPLEADARVLYERRPGCSWAAARLAGFEAATGEVIAYLEDHCTAGRGWARELLATHASHPDWGGVTYGFVNANPRTFVSRCAMVTDYGPWLYPVEDRVCTHLPDNCSYKREMIARYRDRFAEILTPAFCLHEQMRRDGLTLGQSGRAVAAHLNYERVLPLLRADFQFNRLLAARRSASEGWSRPRRWLWALLSPVSAPLFGTVRLGRRLLLGGATRTLIAALPIHLAGQVAGGLGEALGYLLGPGDAAGRMHYWEVGHARRKAS